MKCLSAVSRGLFVALFVAVCGCSSSVSTAMANDVGDIGASDVVLLDVGFGGDDLPSDRPAAPDRLAVDGGAGDRAEPVDRPDVLVRDVSLDSLPDPGVVVCAGVRCAAGQACCFSTGLCFDAAAPATCAPPGRDTDPRACASNAQCAADEICDAVTVSSVCAGVGTCRSRRGPEACGGFGDGVCGCDGQTWPDPCAASRAGVRVASFTPCGRRVYPNPNAMFPCPAGAACPAGWTCNSSTGQCAPDRPLTACALDSHCLPGQFCCARTGLCVANADRELCRVLPDDARVGCRTTADCQILEEPSFGGSRMTYFCAGSGCVGVGGCVRRPNVTICSGVLAPVCGCDGRSYTNACTASAEGARAAHDGMCP